MMRRIVGRTRVNLNSRYLSIDADVNPAVKLTKAELPRKVAKTSYGPYLAGAVVVGGAGLCAWAYNQGIFSLTYMHTFNMHIKLPSSYNIFYCFHYLLKN